MRMCHFRAQNGPFVMNKIFLVQTIIITFIYLLALFIVQNLKKILTADPELWGCTIFGPKMVHFPKWEFFSENLLMSLVSFIHAYLHLKIKVRYYSFSEILTIKEYWNRIGWEPLLAITWEPDFSQACCFRWILMDHRNFHFTQIPDNTNHVIFLKSPVIMFLDYFWPFLVIFARWGFFPKNLALSHTFIYEPLTPS